MAFVHISAPPLPPLPTARPHVSGHALGAFSSVLKQTKKEACALVYKKSGARGHGTPCWLAGWLIGGRKTNKKNQCYLCISSLGFRLNPKLWDDCGGGRACVDTLDDLT